MTADWVARLAEDERRRDDVRLRATQAADRKTELVRAHGQRVLDELRAAVVRDVEAFRHEFPGDPTRAILLDTDRPDGGFEVTKPASPHAALSVAPHLAAASVSCDYLFTSPNGMPPRRDRLEFVFTSGGDDTLQVKLQGTAQLFTNADTLSEYLLMPVLTGRPR